MLTTWLVEIYLDSMGRLRDRGSFVDNCQDKIQAIREEFLKFLGLSKLRECLDMNKNTIYALISSHGALEDLVFFANLMQDYERLFRDAVLSRIKLHFPCHMRRCSLFQFHSNATALFSHPLTIFFRVINHYVKADRWTDALTALRKQSNSELYYKFSPVLMQNAPRETVEIWKAAKSRLDPSRFASFRKAKSRFLSAFSLHQGFVRLYSENICHRNRNRN